MYFKKVTLIDGISFYFSSII